MASLLRRLRSASTGAAAPPPSPPATGAADMFLVQVIAFGEVFAIPVGAATPVTVVLRCVMEAAVSEEQAVEMGCVEATLYCGERPLPLDTPMAAVPRSAVLHLHTSVATTSSVVRDRRSSAVAMLPEDRQRYMNTTITMQPCIRSHGGAACVVRGGSDSPAASIRLSGGSVGLTPERSPSAERYESLAAATRLCSASEPALAACYDTGFPSAPVPLSGTAAAMLWPATSTASLPIAPVVSHPGGGDVPRYYFIPCSGAAAHSSMRALHGQTRTASAPFLLASRRRDSAVDFASHYRFPPPPPSVNPLDPSTVAAATAQSFSAVPSPPSMPATGAERHLMSNDKFLVVYLRLPRDKAAARMSAAALSTARHLVVEAVEADEVPVEALLNTTTSTIATNRSNTAAAYSYRRLRIPRDFPVGTLRELCAVDASHRLHVAHAVVDNEQATLRELRVAPNSVFYFRRHREGERDNQRGLTRERIREHLDTTAAPPSHTAKAVECGPGTARQATASPVASSHRYDAGAVSPIRSSAEPGYRAQARSPTGSSIGSPVSSIAASSTLSIQERIIAFNGGEVQDSACAAAQVVADASDERAAAAACTQRYTVDAHEQTVSSAVAAEEARRAVTEKRQHSSRNNSPATAPCAGAARRAPGEVSTAAAAASPPRRKRKAAAAAAAAATAAAAAAGDDGSAGATRRGPRKTYRLQRRTPAAAAAQRPSADSSAVRGEEVVAEEAAACTPAEVETPKTRRASMLVSKMRSLRGHRAHSTPPTTPLRTPPSLSAQEVVQPEQPGRSLVAYAEEARVEQSRNASPSRRSSSTSVFQRLRRLSSSQRQRSGDDDAGARGEVETDAAPVAAAGAPPPPALPPPSSSEEALQNSKAVPERRSSGASAALSATDGAAAAAAPTPRTPTAASATTRRPRRRSSLAEEERTATPAPAPAPAAALADAGPAVRASAGESYSQRNRRTSASVPPQPVAFLGSSRQPEKRRTPPDSAADGAAAAAATSGGDGGAETPAMTEVSTTLEPAALSTTRIPTPRLSPMPVSILVSTTPEQRSRQQSLCRTPGSGGSGGSGSGSPSHADPTSSPQRRRPDSGGSSPEYSIERSSSMHRLRITLRDPQDPSRFHYGVPVEPDCPVGKLREWVAAMQPPSRRASSPGAATTAAAAAAAPDLRDAARYGIYVGDTYLSEADSVTFAEVTCGRNDSVFSLRPL
ncbi:hypothetical protein NESM_000664600 [Novymonas esmeraldas]|uniref:Uncharacterized protein n=1 Tax=Novymonas esmeraldas TaxID=1808958 RepID=A0AAW0ESJ4_9TRYP